MKVYLDDIRNPKTDGWVVVRTAEEAINLLETNKVAEISLDHDLGDDVPTGYDVVLWIEQRAFTDEGFNVPVMNVHSANPVGRDNMLRAIKAIERKRN